MTCREFKDSAAALTLWELLRGQDEQIRSHAQQCEGCGEWLREQRTLAASLQMLQARTGGLEAGAQVERALLRAFRQSTARSAALAESSSTAGLAIAEDAALPWRSEVVPGSAPIALRLSRFFEIGAYVAVAAAIVVGMFLGVRLLEHSFRTVPVQSNTALNSTVPLIPTPVAAAQVDSPKLASAVTHKHVTSAVRSRVPRTATASGATATAQPAMAEESQPDADAGYVALMFCDPLSCATGSQVVRMELPPSVSDGSQNSQPQIADVVVGYDGVVRAVRLVN